MAYGVLPTVVTGADIVIAWGNGVKANFDAAFPIGVDAWTTWSPTVTQTGSVTVTVTRGRYIRIGRTILADCLLTVTGSGTGGTLVTIGTLPATVNCASQNINIGTGKIVDASATLTHRGLVETNSAGTLVYLIATNVTTNGGMGVVGFTAGLASSDLICLSLQYEATS